MTKELKPLFDYLGSQIDPVLLLKAVEQNPASIVIMDPEGKMIYTNKKFKESTGYSAEEAYGQSLGLLMSDDGYTDYGAMWRVLFQGREWRGDFHNRKKNGELFWERAPSHRFSITTDR